MKIVFVQPLLPLYSISFFNKITEKSDHDLTVLADLESTSQLNQYSPEICNFKVENLATKTLKGIVFRPYLNAKLKSLNADIVIFNGNPRDYNQLLQMIKYKLRDKPFFVWSMFHRIGGPRFYSELYYKFIGLIATKCLSYSGTGLKAQVNRNIPQNRVEVMGTAIDEQKVLTEQKKLIPQQIDSFKEENELNNKIVLLQVVRLTQIKKPHLLIQAIHKLSERRKDFVLILIGGGELEEEIKILAEQLGIKDSIKFLGPIYDESILSYWFSSADIFIMPTCIGLSAHHAMCYSLPIITDDSIYDQASEFDLLYNNLNALIYKSNNIDDLVDKIEQLIKDPAMRTRISKAALDTVTHVHTLENKVDNFLKALSTI